MKAFFLVFIFSLLVTSWLTDAGPPQAVPIGVKDVVDTPSGSDIRDEVIGDFFFVHKDRDEKIMTKLRSSGPRVGDQPRLGIY